jgi:hypothetical protein
MKNLTGKITVFLGSRQFLYGVLAFFALEGLWVACSAVYPMAFDEDFHLGIIKIYGHHWLPFLNSQPESASAFGAVARDPSYLYHYLMSFPYRLLAAITDSQTAQVIVLRLVNVAMFGAGLVLFRKVLRLAGTSAALANTTLALFVLIPIVPLLAGQINYDNLVFPLVAMVCLLAYRLLYDARQGVLNLKALALLAVICVLGSLVKYPFLPMAAVAVLFVLGAMARHWWRKRKTFVQAAHASWRAMSLATRLGLAAALIASLGLFAQRYGLNLVTYHEPVPDCDAVLSEDACMSYGPWARNYYFANTKQVVDRNPVAYTGLWLQALHYRSFFMVNGPASGFTNYPPVPIPGAAAVLIAVSGTLALVFFGRSAFRGRPYLVFLFLLTATYVAMLWGDNYSQYLETGQPVAINGRYLLLVLLPLAAVLARVFQLALSRWPKAKPYVAAAFLLFFLQGGGVMSFILRSDATWYWQDIKVYQFNNAARHIISPFVIEGSKYYQ